MRSASLRLIWVGLLSACSGEAGPPQPRQAAEDAWFADDPAVAEAGVGEQTPQAAAALSATAPLARRLGSAEEPEVPTSLRDATVATAPAVEDPKPAVPEPASAKLAAASEPRRSTEQDPVAAARPVAPAAREPENADRDEVAPDAEPPDDLPDSAAPPAERVKPPPAAPPTSASPTSPLAKVDGRFRYAGGSAQRSRIEAAVDEVVDQMSIISRGIARRRLLEGAEPPSTIGIAIDGKRLKVTFPHHTYEAQIGGGSVRVTGQSGDKLDFQVRSRGGQLMLEFRGKKGGKRYVMRLDDTDRLRMRVTIFSDALPADVVYTLTYRSI